MSMRIVPTVLLFSTLAWGQATSRDIRDAVRQKQASAEQLGGYLNSTDDAVRYEAVKGLTEIGTAQVIDLLIKATHDTNADVQARAVNGLVNFYLPGYLLTGKNVSMRKLGSDMVSRFNDPAEQMIDPFVLVRPDVITAIGRVASNGASINARVEAARAIGVLRGRAAVPDLVQALQSKDSDLIYESLLALKKIRDPQAGPEIRFLLHDRDERVQLLAIETTGILHNQDAATDLEDILRRAKKDQIKRTTLTALAAIPETAGRDLFILHLGDSDEQMRAASAEGLARLANPGDLKTVEKSFADESKARARLALAFAEVMEGKQEDSEYSPLRYLIYSLNSAPNRDVAYRYLTEISVRQPALRARLYDAAERGTRDEKIYLARTFSETGDRNAESQLERISHDSDTTVAQEGLKALKSLRARI